jgi:hypothetical protein
MSKYRFELCYVYESQDAPQQQERNCESGDQLKMAHF